MAEKKKKKKKKGRKTKLRSVPYSYNKMDLF